MILFNVLIFLVVLLSQCLTVTSSIVVDCHQSIHFNGSSVIKFSCRVCCTDWKACPSNGNIYLQIITKDSKSMRPTHVVSPTSNIAAVVTSSSINNYVTTTNIDNPTTSSASTSAVDSMVDDIFISSCNSSLALCNDCSPSGSMVKFSLDEVFGLNLSNTSLKDLPCFGEWSGLQWIDLSDNQITFTGPLFFGKGSSLTKLIVRNSDLKYVRKDAFIHLDKLQYLDMSHNPNINHLRFLEGVSPSLKLVDLRSSCTQNPTPVCTSLVHHCRGNLHITVDDMTKCILEEQACANISCSFSFKESNDSYIDQCIDDSSKHLTSTVHDNYSSEVTGSSLPSSTFAQVDANICQNILPLTFPAIPSKNCIMVLVSGVCILFICLLLIVLVIKWRIKVRRQGRYDRWMSLYSTKVSYQVKRAEDDEVNHNVLDATANDIGMECEVPSKCSSHISSNEEVIIDTTHQSLCNNDLN